MKPGLSIPGPAQWERQAGKGSDFWGKNTQSVINIYGKCSSKNLRKIIVKLITINCPHNTSLCFEHLCHSSCLCLKQLWTLFFLRVFSWLPWYPELVQNVYGKWKPDSASSSTLFIRSVPCYFWLFLRDKMTMNFFNWLIDFFNWLILIVFNWFRTPRQLQQCNCFRKCQGQWGSCLKWNQKYLRGKLIARCRAL